MTEQEEFEAKAKEANWLVDTEGDPKPFHAPKRRHHVESRHLELTHRHVEVKGTFDVTVLSPQLKRGTFLKKEEMTPQILEDILWNGTYFKRKTDELKVHLAKQQAKNIKAEKTERAKREARLDLLRE